MRFLFIFFSLLVTCGWLSAQTTTSAFCKAILSEREKLLKTVDSLPYTYTFSRLIRYANQPYHDEYLACKGQNFLDSLSQAEEFLIIDVVRNNHRSFLTFIYFPKVDEAYGYELMLPQTVKDVEAKVLHKYDYSFYLDRIKPNYRLMLPSLLITKVKREDNQHWQVSCELKPKLIPSYDSLTMQRMKVASQYMQTFLTTLDTNWVQGLQYTRLYKYRTPPFTSIEIKPCVQPLEQDVYIRQLQEDCMLDEDTAFEWERMYHDPPDNYQMYVPALVELSPKISSHYELYFEVPVKNRIACLLLYNEREQETYEEVIEGNIAIALQFFFDDQLNIICVTKTVIQFG